jgi:hypothetical protein
MRVARSGYYAYLKRQACGRGIIESAQAGEVRTCFYEHRRRYG